MFIDLRHPMFDDDGRRRALLGQGAGPVTSLPLAGELVVTALVLADEDTGDFRGRFLRRDSGDDEAAACGWVYGGRHYFVSRHISTEAVCRSRDGLLTHCP